MSLVDQIFEQARVGTHLPVSNAFMQGVQAGQHQQALDAQKRQVAMEIAQAPLRQTLLQQSTEMNSLKLTDLLQTQQDTIQNEQAFQGLAAQVSRDLQSEHPENAEASIWEAVSKNRGLYRHSGMPTLVQDARASLAGHVELQKLKAADKTFTPHAVLVPSATPGEPPYNAIQTGPNSFTLPQSSVTTFTTPEGAVFEQRTGAGGTSPSAAGPGGLPQAVANKLQDKQAELSGSLALLNESLGLISPQNTGPLGKLNRAKEAVQSFVAPGSAAPVTEAQTTFGLTAQSLYKGLKADSQINKLEAAEMRKLANITDWTDMSDPAKAQYRTVADIAALQSILISHKLGRFAQEDALQSLSPERAARYWKAGLITNAEIEKWNELHQFVK